MKRDAVQDIKCSHIIWERGFFKIPMCRLTKILCTYAGASLWGPLKELWETVDGAVTKRQPESVHLLDLQLKKNKGQFLSLFRNPVC